jgi:hypothetical protein
MTEREWRRWIPIRVMEISINKIGYNKIGYNKCKEIRFRDTLWVDGKKEGEGSFYTAAAWPAAVMDAC